VRESSSRHEFILREDDAWPESVNGAALLAEVEEFLNRYAVLPDGAAITVAAWIVSTYCMDAFDHHPLLVITSPEMRCGKTRLLEILGVSCWRPLRVAGISEAALFRVVGMAAPTLLIDEAQMLRQRDDRSAALHDLLCASNRRGSFVLRVGGKTRDHVEQHAVFSPKALAAIGSLTTVITDRAVEIRLRRRTPGERVERFFHATADRVALPIRQRLRRWALDHGEEVAEAYRDGEPPSFLEDREAENWLPLFAIIFALNSSAIPRLEAAAKVLSGGKAQAVVPSEGVDLLGHIRGVLDGQTAISTAELLKALHAIEEAPWAEWKAGKPITAVQLAGLLRPYAIRSKQLWLNGANVRGFEPTDFEEAFHRYLPTTPENPLDLLDPLEQGAEVPNPSGSSGSSGLEEGRVTA
jgi:hypothetical protein